MVDKYIKILNRAADEYCHSIVAFGERDPRTLIYKKRAEMALEDLKRFLRAEGIRV